jgi:hypothetical protein
MLFFNGERLMGLRLYSGCAIALSVGFASALVIAPAEATEFGAGFQQSPGITLGGGSAGTPPPGIYMFDQFFTYQAKAIGPNVSNGPNLQVTGATSGFLFVPGWQFLGATYDAVIVVPAVEASLSGPFGGQQGGIANIYFDPVELSWRLGDSGFFIKANFGFYAPTGMISGPTGLGGGGLPWWSFQPGLVISYLKDGWNLTASSYVEINTKNPYTDYRSGTLLDIELTATKAFGQWTAGPVGYYAAQITDDKSSSYYGNAINFNRYNKIAVGALVGYNFGPVQLNVWALKEVSVGVSGGSVPVLPGVDTASTYRGYSAFASVSYRLWAPDEPAPAAKRPLLFK